MDGVRVMPVFEFSPSTVSWNSRALALQHDEPISFERQGAAPRLDRPAERRDAVHPRLPAAAATCLACKATGAIWATWCFIRNGACCQHYLMALTGRMGLSPSMSAHAAVLLHTAAAQTELGNVQWYINWSSVSLSSPSLLHSSRRFAVLELPNSSSKRASADASERFA